MLPLRVHSDVIMVSPCVVTVARGCKGGLWLCHFAEAFSLACVDVDLVRDDQALLAPLRLMFPSKIVATAYGIRLELGYASILVAKAQTAGVQWPFPLPPRRTG